MSEEDNNLHGRKCRSIYYQLLDCNTKHAGKDITASAYIREFMETSRCDDIVNFQDYRMELESHVNKTDRLVKERIMKFKETDRDEKIAAQACLHYYNYHNSRLVDALATKDWIKYHTVDRVENTLAAFGVVGGHGALKAAAVSLKMLKAVGKK